MRVYEIAKEVGIPNKDLIAKIRALGLEVNNHMSSLDADDVARIKRSLEKEKSQVAAPQQTQRLSTGAVLRRRSSGDKSSEGGETTSEKPPVATATVRPSERGERGERGERHAAPVAPPPAAPAPVVRRRAAVESDVGH